MIDRLISSLSKRPLFGWQITQVDKTSRQSFLALGKRECYRETATQNFEVSVYTVRESGGRKVLGTSSFRMGPERFADFDELINQAQFAAGLVTNDVFELPEAGQSYPDVEMADPSLSADLLKKTEDRVRAAVAKEQGVRLSSAEFFFDRIHTRMVNHRGLDVSQDGTMIELEMILLAKSGSGEKEFISRLRRRFLADLPLEKEIARSAKLAREANRAQLPQTGEFPVVFSEEPLDKIFEPMVAWASGRLKFNRIIDKKMGSNLVGAGKTVGDAVTLWSNGLVKGGAGTCRFDGFGSPMNRTLLIQNNILKRYLANKQYADYLKIPPTGDLGNVEVAGGSTPFGLFLDPGLIGEKIIYHIQAFSAFEPNPITGAFSAEIRAGYEISPSGITPIKGGSVSGVLQNALQNCIISKEVKMRERFLGPEGILFKKLTLAGR